MREIQLTQGKVAVVSDEDYEWLNRCRWQFTGGYARRTMYFGTDENGKRIKETIWMHRLIMNCPDGFVVDHIDGDVLNNQRDNLRICTNRENLLNQKSPPRFGKKYKGVYKIGNRFSVRIVDKGKRLNIGYFSNEEAAANAYNYFAIRFHGEFAWLNSVEPMEFEEWKAYMTSRRELPTYEL